MFMLSGDTISMKKMESFDFPVGRRLAGKYIIQEKLGSGWEGEVYQVQEIHTNIVRAAKLFYPHRNIKFKRSTRFAKKLDLLADCSMVMNYHTQEIIKVKGQDIVCIICEFIEGEMLSKILDRQRGKRLPDFQALHLLYALAKGIESIHLYGEYHGDLHTDNIIVRRYGLGFDIKVIDLHHWGDSKKDNREEDIIKMIRVFYDALGGEKFYKKQPAAVKSIIKGLKRSLILKEFKTASLLRWHIENLDWEDGN
tara:strand:+ start:23265 stop:24023 length:759 start_codon:yes stop_codon:yes gene_type:complete